MTELCGVTPDTDSDSRSAVCTLIINWFINLHIWFLKWCLRNPAESRVRNGGKNQQAAEYTHKHADCVTT